MSNTSDPSGRTDAVPTVATRLAVSTDAVRPVDRFDYYIEEIARRYLNFDIAKPAQLPYRGTLDATAAGDVLVSRNSSSAAAWARTRRPRLEDEDGIIIFLIKQGAVHVRQGRLDAIVKPGMGVLFHSGMPLTIENQVESAAVGLKIPQRILPRSVAAGLSIGAMALEASNPVTNLLSGYIEMFHGLPESAALEVRRSIGTHLTDLAVLALGPNRDEAAQIQVRGLKAARTEAVLKAIRENFARPDVSAAIVGQKLGITDRQVHRLLEETPKSFYEHVLECRLQETHRLLCDPTALALKVADLAFRVGFSDVTYFNRAFKTRFGETPTSVRGASTKNNLARQLRATALPAATRQG